jgi:dolichyl-phosphate beta-glucosyltransferase
MVRPMPGLAVVVPCYNEAERLQGDPLLAFVDGRDDTRLVLVDDGSKDATRAVLDALAARRPDRLAVLALPENRGKAEAVRQGLQHAMSGGADVVGYLDADLSTPPGELPRLLEALRSSGVEVAIGARVALLGRDIQRSAVRHLLGRVFATAASLVLRAPVYDTQCGAKLFRSSPALAAALAQPFLSRWAFDVELLGRLLIGDAGAAPLPLTAFVEVPLGTWHDVGGSKLNPLAMARTLRDVGVIAADLGARRRARHGR